MSLLSLLLFLNNVEYSSREKLGPPFQSESVDELLSFFNVPVISAFDYCLLEMFSALLRHAVQRDLSPGAEIDMRFCADLEE